MPDSTKLTRDRYLTPNQVADLLKVSPVTVRHWSLEGKLKFVTTPGGHRRYSMNDIEEFAQEHGVTLSEEKEDKGLRVLIVDDNRDLARYLAEVLIQKVEGIEVQIANDGFEAGIKIHSFKPGVVLLDLMMPGLNGFDTCWRIKKDEATRHIRVIAMTGFPSDENVKGILAAGAERCLSKPVRVPELLQALGIDVPNSGELDSK